MKLQEEENEQENVESTCLYSNHPMLLMSKVKDINII